MEFIKTLDNHLLLVHQEISTSERSDHKYKYTLFFFFSMDKKPNQQLEMARLGIQASLVTKQIH
jgi:hypothetical protein